MSQDNRGNETVCGICGVFDRNGGPIDEGLLIDMRDFMVSRGPDDAGIFRAPGIGLGHRRLSIIDLSAAGHQPMANEDETVWVAFNGEIYNFPDLRAELRGRHQFRSNTDTEVLLHGYEQWGLDGLVDRVRGMFAFALWDGNRRQLLLARDRVGKKPLFYLDDGQLVYFSSDIKSIWHANKDRLTIDPKAIDQYLFRYYIDPDRSVFQEVLKVPPAGTITFYEREHTAAKRYWALRYDQKDSHTEEEWIERIDHQLERSVQRRLISDVPLGAYLSGGVDSSCVVAMMSRLMDEPVRTFTVGFEKIAEYDERQYAKAVADHVGSDHTELIVRPDVWSMLPALVWSYGEPFADASAVPSWYIAREARKHVTVVLTGDGGDEGFAGYPLYLTADRSRRWRRIPAVIRKAILPVVANALAASLPRNFTVDRIQTFVHYLAGDLERGMRHSACWYGMFRDRLYSSGMKQALRDWHPADPRVDTLRKASGTTCLDNMLELVMDHNLPGDYLPKVDASTMAHSLEARNPFLDSDLLEMAASIPAEMLLKNNELKYLLKKLGAGLVPPEVIYRKKWGFGIPIGHWFRNEWYERVKRMLTSPEAQGRGLFRNDYVRQVLDEHRAGKYDHKYRIWTLLILEIWHRLFIDESLQPTDTLGE